MLIILCVFVFGFIFVKFVLLTTIPDIKTAKVRLEEVQAQKTALEADYNNLDNYNAALAAKKTVNERLGEYLMDNAGISDSIEFVEKLALMIGSEIENVSLGRPSQITEKNGNKYYGFPVNFSAKMPYGDLEEFLKYCEGGSQKIRVNNFNINPEENIDMQSSSDEQVFNSSISLVFYSLDKDVANKLFQFSRSRLQEFKDSDGKPIFIKEDAKLPDADLPQKVSLAQEKKTSDSLITRDNADFLVYHKGYLYGGSNFETFASFNLTKRIHDTLSGKIEVFLTIDEQSYTIETVDYRGKEGKVTGNIPNRNLTMYIQSIIDNSVKEDENLWMDIKVQNNSDKTIRVHINQKGNRIKLMDRDGNEITTKNEKEKVYI
mgnify:CR=1 FL=1